MVMTRTRAACAALAGLAALSLAGALSVASSASAADAAAPNQGAASGRHEVHINPKLLDAYAGYYLLGDKAVLTVQRTGDHLAIQLTGQPATEIFAESGTSFFARAVDAQFTFQTDVSGRVGAVVLHQFGRDVTLPRTDAATAQQVAARTEARVKAQTAAPGTDAAVRLLDSSLAAGKPAYDAMSPQMANVTRVQLPRLQAFLAAMGPIREARFLGVNPQGADVYDVVHANGIARWIISLGPDGKVTSAGVTQGP